MFSSWRTTLFGAIGAVGIYLITLGEPWHTIGLVLSGLGTVAMGVSARDNKVTSEQAKA